MARPNDLLGLRRNDKQLTYLQLLRPETTGALTNSALKDLVNVLEQNTHVRRVRALVQKDFFLMGGLLAGAEDDDGEVGTLCLRRQLFTAVGSLPKLEQLKIDSYTGMGTFPVNVLSKTIWQARQLKELELWDLKLVAVKKSTESHGEIDHHYPDDNNNFCEELGDLRLALQNHPCLQKFTLYNCQSLVYTESDDNMATTKICSLDPLLCALATIPNLRKVYITAAAAVSSEPTAMVAFSCSALEQLCRSKSLQELGLWKFNVPSSSSNSSTDYPFSQQQQYTSTSTDIVEPWTLMAPAMAESNTMKMFEFGKCHLSQKGDEAIAAMLETNTSLEELDLHLDTAGNGYEYGDDGINPEDDCYIVATAKALETHNRTLRSLKLWGLLSRRNQEALVSMIRCNYSLQTCRLLDADCDISVQIEFYIKLNRRGRNHLLTSTQLDFSTWIDFFSSECDGCGKNDLSIIYYYLSMKPSLCQIHSKLGMHF